MINIYIILSKKLTHYLLNTYVLNLYNLTLNEKLKLKLKLKTMKKQKNNKKSICI